MMFNYSLSLESINKALKAKIKSLPDIHIGPTTQERRNPINKLRNLSSNIKAKRLGKPSETTNGEVVEKLEKKYGIYSKPVGEKIFFEKVLDVFKLLWENKPELIQAPLNALKGLITQPMLKGNYGFLLTSIGGKNAVGIEKTPKTYYTKRRTINTGQLFSSIKANLSKSSSIKGGKK